MIALLEGTVHSTNEQSIIILANGIGFEVFVADATAYTHHEKITIQTYVHWSQDNGSTIFGFRNKEEQILFMLLITCQGIGPKIALNILKLHISEMVNGILQKKAAVFNSISGIGTKKAELIILQLHDKVAGLVEKGILQTTHGFDHMYQLNLVLQSLNYSKSEINNILDQLRIDDHLFEIPFDRLLKKALNLLTVKHRQLS